LDPSFTVFSLLTAMWRGEQTGEVLVKYYQSKMGEQVSIQRELLDRHKEIKNILADI
jgi:hypothetical protein